MMPVLMRPPTLALHASAECSEEEAAAHSEAGVAQTSLRVGGVRKTYGTDLAGHLGFKPETNKHFIVR